MLAQRSYVLIALVQWGALCAGAIVKPISDIFSVFIVETMRLVLFCVPYTASFWCSKHKKDQSHDFHYEHPENCWISWAYLGKLRMILICSIYLPPPPTDYSQYSGCRWHANLTYPEYYGLNSERFYISLIEWPGGDVIPVPPCWWRNDLCLLSRRHHQPGTKYRFENTALLSLLTDRLYMKRNKRAPK